MMPILALQGVTRRFAGVLALDGVDLAVPAGSRTAIVGPSGSGKTTLLRLVAGFDAPDEGRIEIEGAVVAEAGRAAPAHLRNVGLVAQDGALFPHLTVAQNIGFGLHRRDPARPARIAALMALTELDPAFLHRRPDELSGGQQQRVALARALAREPRLMLLDEPFSALDTALRASTRRAVADMLARAGVTTLMVTHDQEEALAFADQVAVMRKGRLVQAAPPRHIYAHPIDPETALFLGEALILPAVVDQDGATCPLGRLPLSRPSPEQGPGTIMIRPGQITLHADATGPGLARVTEVDFAGVTCTCAIQPIDPAIPPFRLARPGHDAPTPGDTVRIAVEGAVHLFPPSTRREP